MTVNTDENVGAGLSGRRIAAIAVYQYQKCWLMYRYRRQASSHKLTQLSQRIGVKKAVMAIR
jgi:hypothetical protein